MGYYIKNGTYRFDGFYTSDDDRLIFNAAYSFPEPPPSCMKWLYFQIQQYGWELYKQQENPNNNFANLFQAISQATRYLLNPNVNYELNNIYDAPRIIKIANAILYLPNMIYQDCASHSCPQWKIESWNDHLFRNNTSYSHFDLDPEQIKMGIDQYVTNQEFKEHCYNRFKKEFESLSKSSKKI